MFPRISGIEPEKRVRRSSHKAAIGFGDCEVGSRLVFPVTARGCRHKPSAHRIPPSPCNRLQKRSKSLNDSCSFCCLNKLITFSYSILHSEFSSSQTVSNMAISISFIDESVYSDFLLNFSLSHKKTLCLVFASIRERM